MPVEGFTNTERTGNEIYLKSCYVGFHIAFPSASPDIWNTMRVVIFQWLADSQNDAPAPGEVVLQNGSSIDIVNPYFPNLTKKYRILFDKVYRIVYGGSYYPVGTAAVGIGAGVPDVYDSVLLTKFPRRQLQFSADGNSTGTNMLYLMLVSDSAIAGSPTFTWSSKVNFCCLN